MKTIELKVTGQVQGVFFRASTQDKARQLGLTGRVWNHQDGSVRIIAQGDEQAFRPFLKWLHKGPERAVVEEVKWEEIQNGKNYSGFKVER
ncbi:acylphosphatase [Membranicola marinus]|uniref:acylphosphatase n=1 Tax=Membranihabitans marinus TaxID=1227546 RepID=A0A953LCG3_9BACT|nr:acylphosphatase [Membranihabitans marinus]MBY5957749.1 acylphosphatase [Membranihabitans marinus]